MSAAARKRWAVGLTAAGAGGLLLLWSGLVPIGASGGHWAITDWLLHTAMRQSVKTYAAGIEAPPLDDPALVRRGAAHFETGCAACHGSPARPRDAVVRAMTPSPPDLAARVGTWRPRELFWIVKHGVKFTGMPAWPAPHRDDEVWAVTAFLLRLPTLSATGYDALAFGGGARAGALSTVTSPPLADCVRCHGEDGAGDRTGAFPRLDIQPRTYLEAALRSYADGMRHSGIMAAAVAGLTDDELMALADHYAADTAPPAVGARPPAGPALLARGQAVASQGIPANKIPPCTSCHGPPQTLPRADYPRLTGQYREYLRDQLHLFASETGRGGTRFRNLMTAFAHALEPADIDAVSAWYAAGAPSPTP